VAHFLLQLADWMQEIHVVTRQIMDAFQRRQRWCFQTCIADQAADHRPILLLDLCRFRDYADEAGFGKLWPRRWSA
jgi:hypothetical protein